MKKLLIGTAVMALGAAYMAAPAQAASGVKLGVGGHFKGYVSWINQDTPSDTIAGAADNSQNVRSLDILRETELHFTGETTLDNGLTVGFHDEVDVDGNDAGAGDNLHNEESYAYFSGAWGRTNFGKEDGAAYLLQVAAPSADSNVDGLRQYVAGTNYNVVTHASSNASATDTITFDDLFTAMGGNSTVVANDVISKNTGGKKALAGGDFKNALGSNFSDMFRFDYDQAISGYNNKLTYLTPVFQGFQGGVSYTPTINAQSNDFGNASKPINNQLFAANTANDHYGSVWDLAARYDGQLDQVGITLGGGYSHASLQDSSAALSASGVFYRDNTVGGGFNGSDTVIGKLDDRKAWNVGANFKWTAFNLGGAYNHDNMGISNGAARRTWDVGLDYTTGPFKLGGSYYDRKQDFADSSFNMHRWTGGVVYTYGPGMTFRGSVAWAHHTEDLGNGTASSDSFNSTNFLLGTQIEF